MAAASFVRRRTYPETPQTEDAGTPGSLTRVTVNLVPRASAALNEAADTTGDNRTDTVNRAIQVYAFIVRAMAEGRSLVLVGPGEGEQEKVILL